MTEIAAPSQNGLLPPGASPTCTLPQPLELDCGRSLPNVQIAYDTYGTLDTERSNAIWVCHPLTADQFAARQHPVTAKPGWWGEVIGPGKPLDTNKFFVIVPNILGGCMGSTGPSDTNPETGKPFGLDFPVITIADMVRAQVGLLDHLGIDQLLAVVGGSMGGMQALQWAADHPNRMRAAAIIASAARHTPQNIAFHEVGRQAVMADPDWQRGAYYGTGRKPDKGLSVARMAAHVTYLSEPALDQKFGRSLQDRQAPGYSFDADFQVESYLRHQGMSFVDRFDANSYLYITRAMDYFDLAGDAPLAMRFNDTPVRFLIASFSSDWLYPQAESRAVVKALHAARAEVSFVDLESPNGHDAFLLDEPDFHSILSGFIARIAREAGL